MVQTWQNLDLIQKFVNGVNQVSFALRRFQFDDLECVQMLVEFGLDFIHPGESTWTDATKVDKVLLKMLN